MSERPKPDSTALRALLIEMADLFDEVVATLEESGVQSSARDGESVLRAAEQRVTILRARLTEERGPVA